MHFDKLTFHLDILSYFKESVFLLGFLGGSTVKNLSAMQETQVRSILGWEDPLERNWQSTSVFLPGSPMDRGLAGYSLWGRKELGII